MTSQEQSQIQEIKCRLRNKYPSLNDFDCDNAYKIALADYIVKKYPSINQRPTPENIKYDFIVIECLYKRMDYLVGRAGIPIGVKQYSENNLSFTFDSSMLNDYFDIGLPMAGVPQ